METAMHDMHGGEWHALETFLGGMETCAGRRGRSRRSSLKPSLVEWKPSKKIHIKRNGMTLNPSLVEWKHTQVWGQAPTWDDLETFLGGMETRLSQKTACGLSSLKPSLVEWKLVGEVRGGEALDSLKPSLVEWKHVCGSRLTRLGYRP